MNINDKNNNQNNYPVHTFAIAKRLIESGYELVGAKANRKDPYGKKVIFYFAYEQGIELAIDRQAFKF